MATNTAGSTARELPWQAVHYLRKGIAYNTSGIGTDATVPVGVVPNGAVILWTMVKVTTAFNAGTSNVIDVGTSADDDAFVDGGSGDVLATSTGATYVYRGADASITADTTVYVTYVESGTAATAGAAEVIMAYIPDNDG